MNLPHLYVFAVLRQIHDLDPSVVQVEYQMGGKVLYQDAEGNTRPLPELAQSPEAKEAIYKSWAAARCLGPFPFVLSLSFGGHHLLDGQARNREFPDTFGIPSEEDLLALRLGSVVKLGFELDNPPMFYPSVERMWVKITEITTTSYRGILQNCPAFINLKHGDEVEFEDRHILSTNPP